MCNGMLLFAIILEWLMKLQRLTRGNRTPGSRDATAYRYNSLVVQATCCSSFQLTHMSCEDHVWSIDWVGNAVHREDRTYYSAHNFASTVM